MRSIPTVIGCMLLAVTAWAETLPIYRPVSATLRIVVTKKGRAAAGVPVTVNVDSRPESEPYWSALTDSAGRVFPPKLPAGYYRIYAAGGKRDSTFYVDVTDGNHGSADLNMKLTLPRVGDAEDAAVTAWVSDFKGMVLDQTGSGLPASHIEVLRQDDLDAGSVLKSEADATGHFSAHLDKGVYVAIFYSPGFKSFVSVFEITEKGEEELRIILEVGSVA